MFPITITHLVSVIHYRDGNHYTILPHILIHQNSTFYPSLTSYRHTTPLHNTHQMNNSSSRIPTVIKDQNCVISEQLCQPEIPDTDSLATMNVCGTKVC